MNFSLSEDQIAIQELAKQIFTNGTSDEGLRAFEKSDARFDTQLWQQLADSNLLGIALDESVDGMGLGLLELCLVLEEQGRTLAPVPLAAVLAQAALPLSTYGSDRQKKDLLPGLVAGAHWVTAAFHEVGGQLEAPRCAAKRRGDGWEITGEKVAVPVAEGAKAVLVSASTDAGPALFVVDLAQHGAGSGVRLSAQRATNHARQARLTLSAAPAAPLGDPARGAEALRFALERGRVAACAVALGVATEAMRRTAAYVSQRKQFGKPIGTFQSVALRTADAYIDVECMRSTLWQAVWKLDAGRDAAADVAIAKWWAGRASGRVVHSAQHLHGGIGADLDYPIHRFFLWARQLELELGAPNQQLVALGRLLADGAAGPP